MHHAVGKGVDEGGHRLVIAEPDHCRWSCWMAAEENPA